MVYDKAKIIPGLVIFVGIVTFPIWRNTLGDGPEAPELAREAKEQGACVSSKDYMKSSHMVLLNEWRDQVVRQGRRGVAIHEVIVSCGRSCSKRVVASKRSLTDGCLKCHPNKTEFCDRCHDYVRVKPRCWDCHIATEGSAQ